MSLTFDPKIPDDVFREVLEKLMHAQSRVQFYIGDALQFDGKHRRGKFIRWLQDTGYAYSTLANLSSVAGKIPPERRMPELTFSFHAVAASLKPKDQDRFLKRAIKAKWTVKQLGEEVKAFKIGHSGKTKPIEWRLGPYIDLPELRHAPINEQGVVCLFGMLCKRLGFIIVGIRIRFPDCIAIRLKDQKEVRIEFEYSSQQFAIHRHDPSGCDYIVCWVHDWKECPRNIEVIELSKIVEQSRKRTFRVV
jgi:hypothetical protein